MVSTERVRSAEEGVVVTMDDRGEAFDVCVALPGKMCRDERVLRRDDE